MSYSGFSGSNWLEGAFGTTSFDEPISLVAWVKLSASDWADVSLQRHVLALTDSTASENNSFVIGTNVGSTADRAFAIQRGTSGNSVTYDATDGQYDDIWVPIIGVFASNTSRTVYLEDSSQSASAGLDYGVTLGANPVVYVGKRIANSYGMLGQVAEIAIFNKALTTDEVDALQVRPGVGVPPYTVAPDNCIGYWSLRESKSVHASEWGDGSPHAPALSVNGTPTFSYDHPTIVAPDDISIVDSVSAESGATQDISDSVATLGLTLVKDDVVIACISNNDAGNTLGINDNNGGAFIPITNRVQGASYAHRCFFYVVGDTPLTTFAFDMDAYSGRMSRTYIQLRGANTTLPIQSVEVSTGTSAGVLPNPGRTQYLNTLALAFVTDDNVSTAGDDITGWSEYAELVEANGAAGQQQAAGYRYQPEPGLLKGETLTNTTLVATTLVVNPANIIDVPDSSAVYYVDHSGTATGTAVTTLTHTHGHDIEPGDLILVAININQATPGNVTTITDNQSGTYPFTHCDNFPVNTNGTMVTDLWWRIAGAGEPTSYQFTHNGTADRMSIGTIVFRGVHPTAPFRELPDGANVSYDETVSVFTTICDSAACNPQEMGVAVAWLDNGSGGSTGSVDNNFNFHDDTDFSGVNAIAWASRRMATNETGQTTFTGDSSSGRQGLQFSLVPKQVSRTGHHFVAGSTVYDAANNNVTLTPDFDIRKDDVLIAVLHHSNAGAFSNTEGDFTEYFSEENPTASTSQIAFWQRVCDGTENGSSWEFVSGGGNGRFVAHILQFRGIDTHDIWEVGPSASTRGTVEPGTTLASALTLTTTNPHTIAMGVCTTDNAGVTYTGYPGGFEHEVGHFEGQGLTEVTQLLTSSGTQTVFNATASESQNQVYYYVALKAAEQPYQYVRGEDPTPLVVQRTIQGYPTTAASYDVSITGYTPGNIGIIGCVTDDSSAGEDFVTPDGWTRVDSGVPTAGTRGLRGLYWKVLEPNEPNPTTLTRTAGTDPATAFFMEVSGGRDVAAATTQFVSTGDELASSIVPPALAAPWGAEDNLWITGVLGMDDQASITTWPVGYEDNQLFDDNGNPVDSNEWIALTHRNAPVAYEAPSQFVVSESESIRAFTIVVRPKDHTVYAPAIITRHANVNELHRYYPQRGVSRIDWTNPVTEGLKFFGSFHEGFPYEYVKREHGIPGSAWRGMSPVDGVMAMTINDLDGRTNAVEFPKHDEIYAGISECTIMCFTRNRNSTVTAGQRPYGYMGTGNDPFYLSLGNDGNFVLVLLTTVSSYTSVGADYNVADVEPDRWALWGGTWKNNTLTGRWQHRKDTSPTTTSGVMATPDANADNVPRVGSANVGGTNSWNGWVSFAAFWDRALTDAEWNSMVDNPWQVFHRRPIYIGKPAKRRVVTF